LKELLVDGNDVKGIECDNNGIKTCEPTLYGYEYTFKNIDANHQIEPIFTTDPGNIVTVTATAEPGGRIFPSGNVKVMEGEDITFKITHEPGFRIMDVLVGPSESPEDLESQGPAITYTLENVTENQEVRVLFTEKTDLLAVITKICFDIDNEGNKTKIPCSDEINATIIAGDQILGPGQNQIVVPFEKGTLLPMKVIVKPSYKLTEAVFDKLEAAGIPVDVVNSLKAVLTDQVFYEEAEFLEAVRGAIGTGQPVEYYDLIIEHAQIDLQFLRWETADGTIVEGEISTEKDLHLRPGIGRNSSRYD